MMGYNDLGTDTIGYNDLGTDTLGYNDLGADTLGYDAIPVPYDDCSRRRSRNKRAGRPQEGKHCIT